MGECGDHHTAVLDEDGFLFTWGWGGSFFSGAGCLGLGDETDQSAPVLVDSLADNNFRLASIACGEQHMLALDDQKNVWIWGEGEYGRMGDGGSADYLEPRPVYFFEDNGLKAKQVCAGQAFSLVLTEDGRCFCWGRNDQGQLGIG